jgi:alcohol dehydrogenase, propanol-preferring
VKSTFSVEPLENINDIFDRMRAGAIDGRIVLEMG